MEYDILKGKFSSQDARGLNPLVLAYIGDAVFEVFVRTYLVHSNREMSVHKLHVKAIDFVKAHAQSEFIKGMESELTEEEVMIFKRGRNAKSATSPKNADIQEYRTATGFEALVGYLYITEQIARLNQIFNKVIEMESK